LGKGSTVRGGKYKRRKGKGEGLNKEIDIKLICITICLLK
jgi:hypothetical protein